MGKRICPPSQKSNRIEVPGIRLKITMGNTVNVSSVEIGMNANQGALKGQTVLVVDDYEDNLPITCYILESLGLSAIAETSADKALQLANQCQPALILLDILMPEMSGFEFMQSLRSNHRTSTIPVIAMTALARTEDREKIIQAGCVDWIKKPFEIEDLEAIVQRHL